jgi:hypothetical protein
LTLLWGAGGDRYEPFSGQPPIQQAGHPQWRQRRRGSTGGDAAGRGGSNHGAVPEAEGCLKIRAWDRSGPRR